MKPRNIYAQHNLKVFWQYWIIYKNFENNILENWLFIKDVENIYFIVRILLCSNFYRKLFDSVFSNVLKVCP